MFETIAARMRHSDVNYRLLVSLLASSAAVQAVTAIVRITTSYRILELGLPVVWLGIVSATYAVLPVFIAVWLGRFIDRGHDALATWIGFRIDGRRLRRALGIGHVDGEPAPVQRLTGRRTAVYGHQPADAVRAVLAAA